MGNVHLVTGYAGKAHVAAADHGSLFEAAIRSGQFVLNSGANFAASIISNNEIKLSDGEGIMQGRHFKVDPGSSVSVAVENGVQGQLRNDLIVGRYTKDAETGVEGMNFITLKGTPVEADPTDPEYISGNINAEGALVNDILLYRVPMNGLTVGEPVPLFEVWRPVCGVDSTFKKKGFAADSKAVGDALAMKAETASYKTTFPASGWSSNAPFTQSVTIEGLLETDEPFVDVYLENVENGTEILEAWMLVGRLYVSANNTLTVCCYEEKPTVDIPIILKVVR